MNHWHFSLEYPGMKINPFSGEKTKVCNFIHEFLYFFYNLPFFFLLILNLTGRESLHHILRIKYHFEGARIVTPFSSPSIEIAFSLTTFSRAFFSFSFVCCVTFLTWVTFIKCRWWALHRRRLLPSAQTHLRHWPLSRDRVDALKIAGYVFV